MSLQTGLLPRLKESKLNNLRCNPKWKICLGRLTSLERVILPGSCLGVCAWPAPAGPLPGCVPGRSSGPPRCLRASGADESPQSPGQTGPAWSNDGGRGMPYPGPETQFTHVHTHTHNKAFL